MYCRGSLNIISPLHQYTNLIKIIIFILFATAIFYFGLSHFTKTNIFPIRMVKIYGNQEVKSSQLKILIKPYVKNNFFTVNIFAMKKSLMNLPWVDDVYIRLSWPSTLVVRIKEKKAYAKWKNLALLNEAGDLFYPSNIASYELPTLSGPNDQHLQLLHHLQNIDRILEPLHAKITFLELTPYSTWKLKLDNGMTMSAPDKEVLTRLDHFVKVYPKIVASKHGTIDYVDLRYAHGMAIRWK